MHISLGQIYAVGRDRGLGESCCDSEAALDAYSEPWHPFSDCDATLHAHQTSLVFQSDWQQFAALAIICSQLHLNCFFTQHSIHLAIGQFALSIAHRFSGTRLSLIVWWVSLYLPGSLVNWNRFCGTPKPAWHGAPRFDIAMVSVQRLG